MRVAATAVLIWSTAAFAGESRANPASSTDDADSLSFYRALVEEVDIRRRVNVLFPNPQSLFDGVQVGFVNVGTGNLTFVRRDVVLPAGGPLVFGRVYDSRIVENVDFGPGWRLSLVEELRFDSAGLIYVDASGTARRFGSTSDGYRPASPVPELAGAFISTDGEKATLHDGQGRKRVFEKQAGTSSMMIVSAESRSGSAIRFSYTNGLLSSVSHEGESILDVHRDATGRVVSVSDGHGRSVRYRYTADNLLMEVDDVAGNSWQYEYGADRRLARAVGANGKPFLLVEYDDAGRVRESRSGREYSFAYGNRKTTVTEGIGARHTFEQNHAGATKSLESTTGISWRLGFDAENRVRSVDHPGGRYALDYDADGSITFTEETGGTNEAAEYSYDDSGRLTTVLSGDAWLDVAYVQDKTFIRGLGLDFEFELSGGQVAWVKDHDVAIHVERDEQGYVVGFRGRGSSVRFERNGLRRVVETVYADGLSSRYSYDGLGNRNLAEHSLGSNVAYRHDPAGNIVQVEVTDADGSTRLQKTQVGDMNQVERLIYEGGRNVAIAYDGMGRPTEFAVGSDTIEVSYDELGGLEKLVSTTTGNTWAAGPSERTPRGPDHRAQVLKGLGSAGRQAGHVVLDFDETTFEPVFADALELGVPGLAEARALLAVASPLLGGDGFAGTSEFEKPSNPVFQPDEYRSTNCCVPCDYYICIDCVIGGYVASWSLCYCQTPGLLIYYDPFPYWSTGPDTIGRIIAEYRELNRNPVPSRGDFVKEHSSEHFSKYELNGGDYDYFIPGVMTEIAENVRKQYNDLIDDDPETDYGIVISSGYRNPRRNDARGGKEGSKHQWGRAVDLVPGRLPPNMTEAEAMNRIKEAADAAGGYYVLHEGDHIHVHR